VTDPRAYGIAPHQPSIAGLQQFGRGSYIFHARIEPKLAAVWIEDVGWRCATVAMCCSWNINAVRLKAEQNQLVAVLD
jgi:hypothetical protein